MIRLVYSLFVLLALLPLDAAAHDIPNDISVQMYFRPQGQRLHVLIRVPMTAMRDEVFPERQGGFLDFDKLDPMLKGASKQWLADFLDVYENDRKLPQPNILAAITSLESDKSFASYDDAAAHVNGSRLTNETTVVWNQTMLDVMFEYRIESEQSKFSLHPGFERLALRVVTALRFVLPDGSVRAFEYGGDPGLIRLDPSWLQAAARFVRSGFEHILDGTDHLLFLFCLVIPFRRLRLLIPIVTAFTVAHSITLIASAYNLAPDALWFPALVETLIAASIVYMALENVAGASNAQRRWIITFCFGLVHGFGFSFALRDTLQFAGSHLLTSLLSFNVGVELGQLLVLALTIPALELLFKSLVAERMGTIILSALIAHTSWHWMTDRWSLLVRYRLEWPAWNMQFVLQLLHWSMAIVLLAGVLWAISVAVRRWEERSGRISAERL
ncbi:MAG: HupE/UreJ family protein [Bryobacteraceae bacterium]